MDILPAADLTRRRFVQTIAGATTLAALGRSHLFGDDEKLGSAPGKSQSPWFRRSVRWGQVNLTEMDPATFDTAWWRAHWRRTCIQGIVVNAGGIVAYYPTEVPLHRRAKTLGTRDLFGELRTAGRDEGLAVYARMDSNRVDEEFYRAHPDWFARDARGEPYKVTDLYVACVNSPYYTEHIPAILREVATRYRPEGFTDNNWNGPMRNQPCFCDNCARKFHARSGQGIPKAVKWHDPVYRDWIMWNYERRLEIWDDFNRVTREAGGPDCIWVGMMAGSQSWQSRVFRDDREIYRRTEMVMLDDQRRSDDEGFQHNGEIGKRIRAVGGWDKIIPESMAMYHLAEHNFRLATKPEPEARMWVVEGIAGGVQPWWHHLGGTQEDQRMLKTAEPLWRWHRDHEEFLINRRPVATVGLVWSQRNTDFFGRDDAGSLVNDPWNGFMQALVRAHIPYVPVHIDDIERVTAELGLKLLILPNLAAISDAQVASIRKFMSAGGSLFATGMSSLCNEWGEVRDDFALADLFGAHVPASHAFRDDVKRTAAARDWTHTYLRLPQERHTVLNGFTDTSILAYGGVLEPLTIDVGAVVPLTFVPALPLSPPEDVWMRTPRTDTAGLVLRESTGGGRVAFMPADIDRRFSRDNLPDHGDLLANIVRWAVKDEVPLNVEARGLIDCHLYRQTNRLVLHVVNLTSAGTWRTPVHELIPVGPVRVSVKLSTGLKGSVASLVLKQSLAASVVNGSVQFEIASISDHEVVVIT